MSCTVRPVSRGDTAAWLRLRTALWPGHAGQHAGEVYEFFAGRLNEPAAVLLAVAPDGDVMGLVELSIRPYAEGCETTRVAYVEGWYVEPAWRQRGIGRALIAAAEEWARGRGCRELASDTEADNEASTSAHLAVGFADAGVIRCFSKRLAPAGRT